MENTNTQGLFSKALHPYSPAPDIVSVVELLISNDCLVLGSGWSGSACLFLGGPGRR